jgi:hypothetical protein
VTGKMLLGVAGEHGAREALVDGPTRLDHAAVLRHARQLGPRLKGGGRVIPCFQDSSALRWSSA